MNFSFNFLAMSLATVMWNKSHLKKTVSSSETLTRGSSCREEAHRCWTSVIRSKGDAFYLIDGQRQSAEKYRQPWIVTDGRQMFYPSSGMNADTKNKAQQNSRNEAKRRLSDSDLLQRIAGQEKENRRVRTPMALRSIGDLTAKLIENDPIFVLVSLPTRPVIIGDCQLSCNKMKKRMGSPLNFTKFNRSASPCLSSTRSVTNVGLWPKTVRGQSIEQHHQQSVIFDGRVKLASEGCRSNSLSCPLISPWSNLRSPPQCDVVWTALLAIDIFIYLETAVVIYLKKKIYIYIFYLSWLFKENIVRMGTYVNNYHTSPRYNLYCLVWSTQGITRDMN